jgi:ribosomal-protein-alanine N-acetyltransferase
LDDITLRTMSMADLPRVMEIERACFSVPWIEDMFLYQLEMGDISENIVLLKNNHMVGYLIGWVIYDEIHILNVAVDPEERKQGFAGRMIEKLIERGEDKGGVRVVLEVRKSNQPAQSMYKKYGFRVVGVREGYYSETGEDALVMRLDLHRE